MAKMKRISVIMLVLLVGKYSYGASLFEDAHVVKMPKGKYGPRSMPGDIVELKDGTLLMCYTMSPSWGPAPFGIVARKSSDKGRTWSDPFSLVPNPQPPSTKGYYCHPSFVRLPNGDILLSYIYAAEALPYYGHNYYKRTANEGLTWSEQFVMTPHPGYVIMHNAKLLRLSTGRLIAPTEYKARWPSTNDHGGYVSLVFYSDDQGYSWQVARNMIDMNPHEAQEPHVVELKDGRLLLMFRTYSGSMGRAYSTDKGETWSKGELVKELSLPRSGAVTVTRIPSTGDLLLIRITGAGKEGKRTPLTSAVSRDEGATWTNERHIAADPEGDYGYQSVTFVDNVAVISYHALDGLHVARIGPDWFYGKN
jgi:sialidase-1